MKWYVAASMLVLAFSGCLSDDDEASAKDLSDEFSDEARDWRSGAFPIVFLGAENADPYDMTFTDGEDLELTKEHELPGDTVVGNGKATGWGGFFLARGSSKVLGLAIAADGERLVSEKIEMGADYPEDAPKTSMSDWEIDSPRALGIARDVEGWPDITNDNRSFVGYILAFEPGEHPVWLVVSGIVLDDERARFGFAAIDAKTGELLESEIEEEDDWMDPSDPWGAGGDLAVAMDEGGEVRRSLSILQPVDEGTFSFTGDHSVLKARLQIPSHLPLASARATLTGPEGEEHVLDFSGPLLGQGTPVDVEVPDPVPGEWHVRFELTRGITETVELLWCAGELGVGSTVDACNALQGPPTVLVPASDGVLPRTTPWPRLEIVETGLV